MRKRGRFSTIIIAAALSVSMGSASAQGFPDFSKLTGGGNKDKDGGGLNKLLGGGAGCALGGGLAYWGGKKLGKVFGKDNTLSKADQEKFLLGAALAGCAVGASAGVKLIENMSESAKQAQEDAWLQAQQQTGPVEWQDPNDPSTYGTSELAEIETLPSGERCGLRRDVVATQGQTVEPYQRVCQADNGGWEPQQLA